MNPHGLMSPELPRSTLKAPTYCSASDPGVQRTDQPEREVRGLPYG